MASVPILNTGANTAVFLDNSQVNRSAEKLTSDVLGAEKMKLGKALEDNEKFLQMMAVDPVALMTQRGVEQQSEVMTEFNDKWAGEMKKYKGILPQEKWIEMRKDRIGVESIQGRLGASQQRYLEDLKMIKSAPTKYNREAFMQASKDFYETGEYTTGLAPALGRLNDALDKDRRAYFLSKPNESVQSIKGQQGKIITTTAIGDPKVGSQRVLSLLFNDDTGGYLQDAINEFVSLPEETQMKYFDRNKDGQVTEDEMALAQQFGNDIAAFASNPIIKWAMEEKGKGYQTTKPQVSNPPGSGGFGLMFGQTVKTPGRQASTQTYGDRTYTSLYDFDGSLKLQNIPTSGGVTLRGRNSADINTKGNVEGYLKHYDAEKDVLIIAATGTDPNIDSGTLMEIPVGNLNQAEVSKLPIEVNGKMTTVGAIRGSKPAKKATSGITWK